MSQKQHKMYGTPTYKSWSEMKYRCGNKKKPIYKNVFLCEEWKDFRNFFRDMGTRPLNTSIDRIDGSKGYYKENCRWATDKEQQNNKKTTHLFELNGEKHTLIDWSIILGIKRSTLSQRIYVYKWPVEKALKK